VWKAEELRHPVAFAMEGNFVPNNIDLGMPNFTVITGPNMGGKSTLIRQVASNTVHSLFHQLVFFWHEACDSVLSRHMQIY
jgi:dsDNA-specific endonuclease/ATPase MutS2